MRGPLLSALLLGAGAGVLAQGPMAVMAQTVSEAPAEVTAATLSDLLQIGPLFQVIAEEGAASGRDLDTALLGGQGGAPWASDVARAYDPDRLRPVFEAEFARLLGKDATALGVIADFYRSDLGQRIVSLELQARRAMIDPDTLEAAEVAAERMGEKRDPRLRSYRRLIEAGDMIEKGVTSTLSSYLAFNEGLVETGPVALAPAPGTASLDVYAQEPAIRADTASWLISFMALSYGPLSEAELDRFVDFSQSDEGRHLTSALIAAFEVTMVPVSRSLGQAAGREVAGLDI